MILPDIRLSHILRDRLGESLSGEAEWLPSRDDHIVGANPIVRPSISRPCAEDFPSKDTLRQVTRYGHALTSGLNFDVCPDYRSLQFQEHDGLRVAASSVEEVVLAFAMSAKAFLFACQTWAWVEEFLAHRAASLGRDARWPLVVVSVVSVWHSRF
jgi:hypothetical protein